MKELTIHDLEMVAGGKADWLNIGMPTPIGTDQNELNKHLPRLEDSPLTPPIWTPIKIAIDFFF